MDAVVVELYKPSLPGPSVTHSEDKPLSKYVRNLADDPNHVRLVATLLLSWVVKQLMTGRIVAALKATSLTETAWCPLPHRSGTSVSTTKLDDDTQGKSTFIATAW